VHYFGTTAMYSCLAFCQLIDRKIYTYTCIHIRLLINCQNAIEQEITNYTKWIIKYTMWIVHECWYTMFTCGKYKRMYVERSKHDQLWTTRRRVTINVDMKRSDDGDRWWDVGCGRVGRLATTSAVPLPTGRSHDDWRRSLRTPRMTAAVTAMTYTPRRATGSVWPLDHRWIVTHVGYTAQEENSDHTCTWTSTTMITRQPSLSLFDSIFQVWFLQKENKIEETKRTTV